MTASRKRRTWRELPLISLDPELRQDRQDRLIPLMANPVPLNNEHHPDHLAPSWLDLLLDLGVVATLNVFSNAHDINDGASLATFTAYIILLFVFPQSR